MVRASVCYSCLLYSKIFSINRLTTNSFFLQESTFVPAKTSCRPVRQYYNLGMWNIMASGNDRRRPEEDWRKIAVLCITSALNAEEARADCMHNSNVIHKTKIAVVSAVFVISDTTQSGIVERSITAPAFTHKQAKSSFLTGVMYFWIIDISV